MCIRDSATGVGAIGTTTDLQLSFGIFSLGNVNISGGDVTGIGGTGGLSGGIVGNHTLTITGGTVVGEGGPLALSLIHILNRKPVRENGTVALPHMDTVLKMDIC